MDKNTIYGLILMAAIFFGFMWLSPKNENQTDTAADQKEEVQSQPSSSAIDTLSESEFQWLRSNISDHGTAQIMPDSSRVVTFTDQNMELTLRGDSISGFVKIDGQNVSFNDVIKGDLKKISADTQRKAIAMLRNESLSMGKFGKFAKFLHGDNQVIKLENDVISLQFSTYGGTVTRAELKKYYTEYNADENVKTKEKVVIFNDTTNSLAFQIPLPQAIETSDLYFEPKMLNDTTLLMALNLEGNAYWGIEYTLPKGDSYVLGIRIVQNGMQPIVQSNNRNLGVMWKQEMKRQEKGRMFEERNSGLYYKFAGGSVENLSENKNDSEERQAKVKWIGYKNQFFSSVLISRKSFNTADFNSTILKNSDYLKKLETEAVVNDYDWYSNNPANFDLFIGPNLYPLLSSLDKSIETDEDLKMTKLIPLGWNIFRWINTGIIIPIFSLLGSWISNYGIIILILTIFIKLVLFPFTYKSYKSQAKMRVLAPDIKAINDKYPGNENAMIRQQKTMALYSKAGANPMSGCLPMLLQMPVLFAMFSFFPSCIELRGESFLWVHDLSAPDAIISWSGNIPLVTEYFGNHISLFCLLMTVTNIIYTYINMQNSGNQMPGMKWMMYLMPVFFMIFFNNYAAGLSYYYFLSLLITIIQTYAFRFVIKEEDVRKAMAENAKKPRKKSGFMARLEEAQRQQQQMLREQQKNNRRR